MEGGYVLYDKGEMMGFVALRLLFLFGAELFVFQVAIQKFKDQDIYRTIILPVVCMGVKHGR